MNIDEAINFVENMLYLYRPTGEHHDKWCELLNLLRWYGEQDLIRREDAIKILAEHIELTTDMDEEQALFVAEHQYRMIPKAEYGGESDGD